MCVMNVRIADITSFAAADADVLKALRADLLRELDAVEDCTVKSKWLRKQLADCRKTV